jgi:arginyl-tRNA synthetase
VSDAFATAGHDPKFGKVTVSDRPDLCQFQCNGALQAAKEQCKKPRDVALKVIEALRESPESEATLAKLYIAGPGFINIDVTDAALAAQIVRQAGDGRLGIDPVAEPKKIVIDYGGANVAKPMHVGHLRSSIIGDCLKHLGRALGHDVLGDIHLGDWGLQMGMLIAEMARRHPELPYFDADATEFPAESPVTIEDLERLYPEASARAKQDPEAMEAARLATAELQAGRPGYRALWRHFVAVSVAELRADFASLSVEFELWFGESDVADRIPGLIERLKHQGAARVHDGALIVDVAEEGDKRELPPLLLTKSDGAALYATTDLATLEQRVEEGVQLMLYVVDNRQADHFEQVFRAARKSTPSFAWSRSWTTPRRAVSRRASLRRLRRTPSGGCCSRLRSFRTS